MLPKTNKQKVPKQCLGVLCGREIQLEAGVKGPEGGGSFLWTPLLPWTTPTRPLDQHQLTTQSAGAPDGT